MSKFENVTVVKAANIYYDGKVTSRVVEFANGDIKTLGIMMPGEYHFGTEKKEIIILDDLSREPIQRTSTMLRIGSSQESESLADRQYVTRGAHYLRDGETVKIVAEGN